MMKNDNRAKRWVLNVTAFVILLPVLLYPLIPLIKTGRIQSLIKGVHWLGLPLVVLIIAFYVASLIFVLWKGRLRLAVIAVFLSFVLLRVSFSIRPKGGEPVPRQLVIPASEIDVYCNDVYLGKTPLRISETEFHEKVKPWDTPPRQKMVIGEDIIENIKTDRDGLANTKLRWYYIPYHYFDQHRAVNQQGFSSYDDAVNCGYWWRFEKDGCTGFATIARMGSYPYPASSQHIRIRSMPDLEYPSLQSYLEHLIHDLKQSNYQPSVEWKTHVLSSSWSLFRDLYMIGQRDSRVMQALEMAIQAEFGIHEGMSLQAWETVLDEIMSRTKQQGDFHPTSPESMAMDMIIRHNTKPIETRFLKLLSRGVPSALILKSNYMGSGIKRAEFMPLEYAVLKSSPPALFKRLVYESRRGERFLSMVGNYPREEALRLVRRYLDDVINHPSATNASSVFLTLKAMDLVTQLRNPAFESEQRRFVLKLAERDPRTPKFPLRMFLRKQLEHTLTEAEANSLAKWIAESIPLPEDEKLLFLIRLNSPQTYRYVRDILQHQPSHQKDVVRNLAHNSNPALDLLLIEIYQAEYANAKFGGTVPITPPRVPPGVSHNLIRAMFHRYTPRMHTFLEGLWNASDSNKISLLKVIKQDAPYHHPYLDRWTTLISEIEDTDTRLAAIPVLDQIDTPESSALLAAWALRSDPAVEREAEQALANYRERSRRAKALLAGSIKPDDLLVGKTAYVWNGQDYVPEAATSADK